LCPLASLGRRGCLEVVGIRLVWVNAENGECPLRYIDEVTASEDAAAKTRKPRTSIEATMRRNVAGDAAVIAALYRALAAAD